MTDWRIGDHAKCVGDAWPPEARPAPLAGCIYTVSATRVFEKGIGLQFAGVEHGFFHADAFERIPRPTAAPPIFPFPDHRTLAQIDSTIRCQTCGDDVDPSEKGFSCAYRACPINREPLW